MALWWARTIDEKPHMFAATGLRDEDWLCYCGGWQIGRAYRVTSGPQRDVIHWSLTGPVTPEAPLRMSGTTASIAAAQEELVSAFARWLVWAEL